MDAIGAGDTVSVNFDTGVITDETTGKTFQAEPFPPFIQKIIADKVSQENADRTFRCTFNLKAGDYSRNAEYFLVIHNTDNDEVVQKVSFQIDTAFQKDDFNFME